MGGLESWNPAEFGWLARGSGMGGTRLGSWAREFSGVGGPRLVARGSGGSCGPAEFGRDGWQGQTTQACQGTRLATGGGPMLRREGH